MDKTMTSDPVQAMGLITISTLHDRPRDVNFDFNVSNNGLYKNH